MSYPPSEEAAAPVPGSPGKGDAQPSPGDQASVPSDTAGEQREYGGRKDGTEPTRFGDWEKQGRCIDF